MSLSATRNMRKIKACLGLLLAAACLASVSAQEATSVDADGNSIIYSVGLDDSGLPTTDFLETIPAAGASTEAAEPPAATAVDPGDASAIPPGVLPDPTSNPVVTRDDAISQDATTASTRPVTYVVYLTIDGVQVTSIATFTPSTPTPTTTIAPKSGTMVDIATYLPPPPPTSSSTGGAQSRYWPSSSTALAACAVFSSMLIGALAV
ncbi:hypothetical protein P389DRAFT_191380 [Cystobasidium minutum MCA 4210]|uniref:uncharacterized protein n=1 Tax=Cystobasidium minutum MCA 4210 TaxID=1397322 RepID=UPI0034CE04DB|eukprot:jgi/Rhomi1/191380/estExt_fgenesh1_pg.C_80146